MIYQVYCKTEVVSKMNEQTFFIEDFWFMNTIVIYVELNAYYCFIIPALSSRYPSLFIQSANQEAGKTNFVKSLSMTNFAGWRSNPVVAKLAASIPWGLSGISRGVDYEMGDLGALRVSGGVATFDTGLTVETLGFLWN